MPRPSIALMPNSYSVFNGDVAARVRHAFPDHKNTCIVDVGAGSGKYRHLLPEYPLMDAVEIHQPYVAKFNLDERYREVFVGDVCDFEHFDRYHLAIFGDVIEHLPVKRAQQLLSRCGQAGCSMIVAIPYRFAQGVVENNEHERHIQDDLTHETFLERYSGFSCMVRNEQYGVYVRDAQLPSESLSQPKTDRIQFDLERLRDVRLAIGTPIYGGQVTTKFMESLWATGRFFQHHGGQVDLLFVQSASVDRSRNQIVARFMADPSYTHLLFIDADQGWTPRDILRLIHFDKDFIGIASRKKTLEPIWALNFIDPENVLIEEGAMEVREIGTGFLMLKRTVFERMMKEYPEFKVSNLDNMSNDFSGSESYYYMLFQFALEDGRYMSEDLIFCNRWRRIGGRIWCDPMGDLVHVGQYEYSGSVSSLFLGEAKKEKSE